jgi:hypothetical protein
MILLSNLVFLTVLFIFLFFLSSNKELFGQPNSDEDIQGQNQFNKSETEEISRRLNLSMSINPDIINVGQKFDISIFIENSGPSEEQIDSLKLIPTWEVTRVGKDGEQTTTSDGYIINQSEELFVKPNTTEVINGKITVPQDSLSGEYNIAVLMSSSLADKVISSSIVAKKFDSLPLSGNIPFSILFLVIAGGITYYIYNFVRQGTVKGNYAEWALSTTSVGFVIWYILYYMIPSSSVAALEILSDNVTSVIILLASALLIGSISGSVKRFGLDKISQALRENKATRIHRLNLFRKGYTEVRSEPILQIITKEQAALVNNRLGQGYTLMVSVTIQENNIRKLIYGLLKRVWVESGIELSPKYIFRMSAAENVNGLSNFNAIITILMSPYNFASFAEPSTLGPLALEIKEDKYYLKQVTQYLKRYHDIHIHKTLRLFKTESYYIRIADKVGAILTANIANQNTFLDILDSIDFSRLVKYIANDFDRRNKSPRMVFKEIFIDKELVKMVRFINYETRISLFLEDENITIPKSSIIKDTNFMYDRR